MALIVASPPSTGPVKHPVTLQGRLVHKDGSGAVVADEGKALKQSDVASMLCSIYDLDSAAPGTAVSTPAVNPAGTVLDTLTNDEIWTADGIGRNFIHTPAGSTWADPHRYLIEYSAVLSSGLGSETIRWGYEHHAFAVSTSSPHRVGEDEVRAIVETDPNLSLAPFIAVADRLTTRVKACAAARGRALSRDQLRDVETWLAAYFYLHRDPQYTSKGTQSASGSFQALDYLETAKSIDVSGCLRALMAGNRAGAAWLGKPRSKQTDYSLRD